MIRFIYACAVEHGLVLGSPLIKPSFWAHWYCYVDTIRLGTCLLTPRSGNVVCHFAFADPSYISCIGDVSGLPALKILISLNAGMTPGFCKMLALPRNYMYAAVRRGQDCYGGNGPDVISHYWQSGTCDKWCVVQSGMPTEICGGSAAWSLYTTGKWACRSHMHVGICIGHVKVCHCGPHMSCYVTSTTCTSA